MTLTCTNYKNPTYSKVVGSFGMRIDDLNGNL